MSKTLQLLSGVVVLAFWWSYADHRTLTARRLDVIQHSQRPYIVNGFHIDLEGQVIPRLRRPPIGARYLLLVTSDDCRYSREALPSWRAMLERIAFDRRSEVIVLSMAGTTIATEFVTILDRKHVPTQLVRPRSVLGIIEHTDLSLTPALLLLDSQHRVRLVASGISPAVVEQVDRFLGSGQQMIGGE